MQKTITMLMCCNPQFESAAAKHLEENAKKVPFLDVKTKLVPMIESREEYNLFIVKKLADAFDTDYVMLLEFDSLIMDPKAWMDEFLKYDYIGAPWHNGSVGNSGFSLGSKRFYKYFQGSSDEYTADCTCDYYMCTKRRTDAEKAGLKFAPYDLAKKFSVEWDPYIGQFGAHGMYYLDGKPVFLSMNKPK